MNAARWVATTRGNRKALLYGAGFMLLGLLVSTRLPLWPAFVARSFLLWYASSMNPAKRKVSVSLDEDLVEELEREDQGLSAQVNVAVRAELERRRRHRLLVELLDQLDAERGPVDESLIEKYIGLLG
jgi:post-segregation antitoxin (ccd killing protein)